VGSAVREDLSPNPSPLAERGASYFPRNFAGSFFGIGEF